MSEPTPSPVQPSGRDGLELASPADRLLEPSKSELVQPELLKIGDFARLAGTNLRTLRYYEELGLLAPASRSKGGFRYYRRSDVNRLDMIKNLQELGLQLERIRDLMATRRHLGSRHLFLSGVREALGEQERLLSARIEDLELQRKKLKSALGKIEECEDCCRSPTRANNFCEPCQETGAPLPADVSALF